MAFAALRVLVRPERVRGRALAVVIGALVLVAFATALVLPSDATARMRTLTDVSGDRSSSFRMAIGRDSLRLALTSPLVGSGFGAYADVIPRFKSVAGDHRVEHAENDYLELLSEGGLAAALLAGFAAFAAIAGALRRLRDEPHRLSRGIRAGALAGVIALLVHSAFDFNLRIRQTRCSSCCWPRLRSPRQASQTAQPCRRPALGTGVDPLRRHPRRGNGPGDHHAFLRSPSRSRRVRSRRPRRPSGPPLAVARARHDRAPAASARGRHGLGCLGLVATTVSARRGGRPRELGRRLDPQHEALRRTAELVGQIQPRRP